MVYQVTHGLDQIPDFPLCPGAETFICHVDQLPQIAGQIQRSGTGVRKKVSGIFVGNTLCLTFVVPVSDSLHRKIHISMGDGQRSHVLKAVLRAVPLTALGKAAMPVSYQLMGTGSGDTFNLEGEIDMFEHAVVTILIKMLHQSHRIIGGAVITD
jgi:hypothetical protein